MSAKCIYVPQSQQKFIPTLTKMLKCKIHNLRLYKSGWKMYCTVTDKFQIVSVKPLIFVPSEFKSEGNGSFFGNSVDGVEHTTTRKINISLLLHIHKGKKIASQR